MWTNILFVFSKTVRYYKDHPEAADNEARYDDARYGRQGSTFTVSMEKIVYSRTSRREYKF